MAQEISIGRLMFSSVFIIGLTTMYYMRMNVLPNENRRTEMLKKVFVMFIILGLINLISTSDNMKYKLFIVTLITCIINIYNSRYIFKYCNSITPQFKITIYIRSCIIIIITSLLLYYANNNDIYSFLYSDGQGQGSVGGGVDQLSIALKKDTPIYCPDMSNNTYLDESTDAGITWNNLSTPSQNICINKLAEYNQRKDMKSNIYA